MNLSTIKDFFTCQANAQEQRIQKISAFLSKYRGIGIFSLFKQLSQASASELNTFQMKKYMSQFSNNFQIVDPNEIVQLSASKEFGNRKSLSDEQILEKGINLFLNFWGNNRKQFSFCQLSKFLTNEQCLPEKAQQVPYHAKKKLFQIFQTQIQNLLNIETLRQVCIKQYKNLTDLFETLASRSTHQINRKSLENLYLMHSDRMNETFYDRLQIRLKLPIYFQDFLQIFKRDRTEINPKVKQRKVHYSSARRNKNIKTDDFFDEDNISNASNQKRSVNFQTPQTEKVGLNRGVTSTKLTKGEKISELKQASISVGRFKLTQTPERLRYSEIDQYQSKQIQILGEILAVEETFIQLKRNLCLSKDFDLELVYEKQMERFSHVLNQVYGCCNFTSFVRFVVPQDFQYQYLSFIRYQQSNVLSTETIMLLEQLFQTYERKERQISQLWDRIDRQMMFRIYCNPCDQSIKGKELSKYFTERECRVLLDRMDPLKTGYISYQNFK